MNAQTTSKNKTNRNQNSQTRNNQTPRRKRNQSRSNRSQTVIDWQATNNNFSRPSQPNIGLKQSIQPNEPRFKHTPDGVVVSHVEFVTPVVGAVDFTASPFPINPGLATTFPWLFKLASQYESYTFRKLNFKFVNSKTGTFAGAIILGLDYDAADSQPTSEMSLQLMSGTKTGVITDPLTFKGDSTALKKILHRYVRAGEVPADTDVKTYDAGNFFLAVSDCADTSKIGRLFVEYEVEFKTPQRNALGVSYGTTITSPSQTAPLGTGFDTASPLVTWLSGTTFRINVPGSWSILYSDVGTVMTVGSTITVASPSSGGTDTTCADVGALKTMTYDGLTIVNGTDVITVSAGTNTTRTSASLRLFAR